MAQTLKKILLPIDEVEARSTMVEPFSTLTLDAPPSCLKFIKNDPDYPHHLLAGTYSLDCIEFSQLKDHEPVQGRSGSLVLLNLKDRALEVVHTHATPYAVLDVCFLRQKDHSVLVVATSIGSVELFHLTNDASNRFKKFRSFQVADPSVLVLSLAWSPGLEVEGTAIGLSLSNGQIGFIAYSDSEQNVRLSNAHSMEAWSVAWSKTPDDEGDHLTLYSGGDDSVLCKSGNIVPCDECDGAGEIFRFPLDRQARDLKTHQAGVTAILPISYEEEPNAQVIVTGSYDEHIRVLTFPSNNNKATVLAEERILGGGVWKLEEIASHTIGDYYTFEQTKEPRLTLLASCMHAGARIVEVSRTKEGKWTIQIAAKCIAHESMNYASDAKRTSSEDRSSFVVVSSSFYDKKLCAWDYKITAGQAMINKGHSFADGNPAQKI